MPMVDRGFTVSRQATDAPATTTTKATTKGRRRVRTRPLFDGEAPSVNPQTYFAAALGKLGGPIRRTTFDHVVLAMNRIAPSRPTRPG